MKKYKLILPIVLFVSLGLLAGCDGSESRDKILKTQASQLEARSIQTRAFDTSDKEKTLRVVISTLQDLGFVVDKADLTLGTVSATKLSGYMVKITVTVRPRGADAKQMLVRANARYGIQDINDAKIYQDFFAALSKALFLEAHNVE